MTNWGTFTPSGLEIQIQSCVWWMGNQQRARTRADFNPCSVCYLNDSDSVTAGAQPPFHVSSGERWHYFTHLSSLQVTYFSALLGCHLSAVHARAATCQQNTARSPLKCKMRSIKHPPIFWDKHNSRRLSRHIERKDVKCVASQSIIWK